MLAPKSLLALALCLVGLGAVSGAAQQPTAPASPAGGQEPPPASPAAEDGMYRIGPGDMLDVTVFKNPELSLSGVRVGNDGKFQMPRIDGDITAACHTERDLALVIQDKYRRYIRNPHVTVVIKEYNSKPVAVIGAVNAPGRFQLQRRVRLLELLTLANGPSANAGRSLVITHAPDAFSCESPPATTDAVSALDSYPLEATLQARDEANPYVRPGDIVRLLDAEQVFVIGNVKTPAQIALKEEVTLSKAVAIAGGALPDSDTEKVRIIRQTPGSTAKTEIVANLKAINRRHAADIVLQPNDVVEITGKGGSGRKILQALLGNNTPMSPLRVIRPF